MKLTFIRDFHPYAKDQSVDINQYAFNLVVGDNGAGKTSLMRLLEKKYLREVRNKYYTIDGMKNQAVKKLYSEGFRIPRSPLIDNREDAYRSSLSRSSHGEAWKKQLDDLEKQINDNMFILMDEPETSLSIESQIELGERLNSFRERYEQFGGMIATHSLLLIEILGGTVIHTPSLEVIESQKYVNDKYRIIHDKRMELSLRS